MSSEQLMASLQQTLDKKQAAAAARNNGDQNVTALATVPFGDTEYFFLPPLAGKDLTHEVWLHFGFIDEKGQNRVYQCSKKNHGSCPICDHIAPSETADKKKFDDLKAKRFYLFNVVDKTGENKILSSKPSQQEAILAEILATYKIDKTDVTNMANGRWLMVSRLKAQPWCRVRTGVAVALNPATVGPKMKDLSTYYRDYTPQELGRVVRGEPVDPPAQQAVAAAPVASAFAAPTQQQVPAAFQAQSFPQAPAFTAPQAFAQPVVQQQAPVQSAWAQPVNTPVTAQNMSAQQIIDQLNS